MRWFVIACVLALSLSGCRQAPEPASQAHTVADPATQTARLNAWLDGKYEEQLRFSPIQLSMLGRKELNDRIDDQSEQAVLERLAWRKASVEALETQFDHAALTEEGKLSYDLWKQQYEDARSEAEFLRNGYPFSQMQGPQSMLPTFLIGYHQVDDETDLAAYVSRIGGIADAIGQLLERARAGADGGTRAPRFAYDGVIDEARKVVTGAPFTAGADSALWADFQSEADALQAKGAITAERANELEAQARAALVDKLQPAYAALIDWAEADRIHAPGNASGVGSTQPNGAAYYAYKLREQTNTDLDADAIHALGLREVERIHAEMNAIKDQVGFQGDLPAFFDFVASDPRFRYPDTDAGRQAYIDAATTAIGNIKQQLPAYFGLLPKADLVVKRVEAFREQPGGVQHYFPGTPDGSRPGVYYAHLSDMEAMPIPELEAIAYHEGLPGHHMQISIAQELTGLPEFRKQAFSNAYVEGWGLYAEALAREMPGTYADPYSDYGRLSNELWRAIRLVVDTGLHAKGWTEEQAVQYFDDNSGYPLTAIRSEIQRYLVWPGQATGYKIGMLRLQELRRKAEAELGEDFDIKGFHDAVLGGGSLPLNLLERRVDAWIAGQKRD